MYLKGDVVWVRSGDVAGASSRTFLPMGLDEALMKKAGG